MTAFTLQTLDMGVNGERRGGAAEGLKFPIATNESNEQIIVQGMPPLSELLRRFDIISGMNTSANAALVVRPSTVANITLYNNETAGGKIYIPVRVFAHQLVTTAALSETGLWYCVHSSALVSPTNDITARSSSRGDLVATKSILDTAMTVIDDGWFPIGTSVNTAVVSLPGAHLGADFNGLVAVPPGKAISATAISSVTGNTLTMGFSWIEVPARYFTFANA